MITPSFCECHASMLVLVVLGTAEKLTWYIHIGNLDECFIIYRNVSTLLAAVEYVVVAALSFKVRL